MKLVHFLYCPFTGLGLHGGYRGDTWLKNRIKVFKQFVLPSLQNQTNKDFTLWISWRPEEKENPIVQEFVKNLESVRDIKTVHTYSGVCFWDDKYSDNVAGKRLRDALDNSLVELEDVVGAADTVLMTIQPSDDMYHALFVQDVQDYFEKGFGKDGKFQVIGFKFGYIMNYATKEVAEYNPVTSPPFYTIRFTRECFLREPFHYAYTGPYKSHEYVKDFLKEDRFMQRGFVVGTHGENISTTFNHPYKGRTLTGEEREKVLLSVGALYTEPIVIKRPLRLIARKILNLIPLNGILRKTYHKLPASWQRF